MKHHRARALTLVELIVAVGLLALAFAGTTSLYYQTSTFSRSSANRADARTIAETQIAVLRRTLRSAPLVNGGTDNRDAQFLAVLSAIDANAGTAPAGTTTFQGAQNATIDQGRTQVLVTTTAFVDESVGEAGLGLTAGSLDLDADGTAGGVGAIDRADLWALPVRVTVTWRTVEGGASGATETITATGVLY